MSAKFKSRKFWIAVGTVFSIAISEWLGVDVAPEAIAGLVVAASSYMFAQGIVDKGVVSKQVAVAGDTARLQMQLYITNLEAQLEDLVSEANWEQAPDQGLTIVPDLAE